MTDGQPQEMAAANPPANGRLEREPFWGYQDLLLFAAMALPSLLAAAAVMKGVLWVLPPRTGAHALQILGAQFLGYGLWFLWLYMLLKARYRRPFWQSLGWIRPLGRRRVGLFLGPVVALAVGALAAALGTPDIDTPIKELLNDRFSLLLVGVFASTLGPLCEELAFRGFLFPLLARTFGPPAGVLLAAVPFALLHGPQYAWSWQHLVLILLAGVAFGWVRHRTGSTSAATLVHATYNLTFFTGYLLQGGDFPTQW